MYLKIKYEFIYQIWFSRIYVDEKLYHEFRAYAAKKHSTIKYSHSTNYLK